MVFHEQVRPLLDWGLPKLELVVLSAHLYRLAQLGHLHGVCRVCNPHLAHLREACTHPWDWSSNASLRELLVVLLCQGLCVAPIPHRSWARQWVGGQSVSRDLVRRGHRNHIVEVCPPLCRGDRLRQFDAALVVGRHGRIVYLAWGAVSKCHTNCHCSNSCDCCQFFHFVFLH